MMSHLPEASHKGSCCPFHSLSNGDVWQTTVYHVHLHIRTECSIKMVHAPIVRLTSPLGRLFWWPLRMAWKTFSHPCMHGRMAYSPSHGPIRQTVWWPLCMAWQSFSHPCVHGLQTSSHPCVHGLQASSHPHVHGFQTSSHPCVHGLQTSSHPHVHGFQTSSYPCVHGMQTSSYQPPQVGLSAS